MAVDICPILTQVRLGAYFDSVGCSTPHRLESPPLQLLFPSCNLKYSKLIPFIEPELVLYQAVIKIISSVFGEMQAKRRYKKQPARLVQLLCFRFPLETILYEKHPNGLPDNFFALVIEFISSGIGIRYSIFNIQLQISFFLLFSNPIFDSALSEIGTCFQPFRWAPLASHPHLIFFVGSQIESWHVLKIFHLLYLVRKHSGDICVHRDRLDDSSTSTSTFIKACFSNRAYSCYRFPVQIQGVEFINFQWFSLLYEVQIAIPEPLPDPILFGEQYIPNNIMIPP